MSRRHVTGMDAFKAVGVSGVILSGVVLSACAGLGWSTAAAQGVPRGSAGRVAGVQAGVQAGVKAGGPVSVRGLLRLRGSGVMGSDLVPALVVAFGRANGLTGVTTVQGSDTDPTTVVMEGGETERTVRAEILSSVTAAAFSALADGSADLGMASRGPTVPERTALRKAGFGDPGAAGASTPISLDGIAVLVHPDNPVSHLSLSQLRAVFGGTVTNWSAVGGRDLPITVYGRPRGSGTQDTFRGLALGGGPVMGAAHEADTDEDAADAVASDLGGIGFAGLASVRNAKALSLRLDCGLDTAPTRFLVRAEEYPLSRRLVLYGPDRMSALTRAFLQFATSDAAAAVVEHTGFTSFTPEVADAADRAARLRTFALGQPEGRATRGRTAEFAALTEGWRRVSTTFRFDFAGSALDARARDDVGRLAGWLRQDPKLQFMLVGYASGQGVFSVNQELSLRRAREVATRLKAAGVVPERVSGVGTMGPVGCDDSDTRGGINRRVEVWVR